MTALEKFIRLEAVGQWCAAPKTKPREVIVSFGNATLMLRDINDRPLGHWSLQATQVQRRDENGVTYATDPRADETLHIADFEMIRAIAAVTAAQSRQPALPRKSRRWLVFPLGAVLVATFVWYGPGLLRRQTALSISAAQAQEIGGSVLAEIISVQGASCDGAQAATETLLTRLFGMQHGWHLHVLDLSNRPSASLPGAHILIDKNLLKSLHEPDELAGYIALEAARAAGVAPLTAVLAEANLSATLRLFLRGHLDPATARNAARQVLADPSLPARRYDFAASATLSSAQVSTKPFSSALTREGVAYDRASAFDMPATNTSPALSDQDWVALQDICDG